MPTARLSPLEISPSIPIPPHACRVLEVALHRVKNPPSLFRAYPGLVCGECGEFVGSDSGRPPVSCAITFGGDFVPAKIPSTLGSDGRTFVQIA
eukprot:CAMPEP_0196720000 /NCGR_PEP_ID=MMETSP1091-20130531/2878_1 /TAXON_ID=302021 /ORGANISM="Rhodomonas sp., Strain CCMP768" /LENGTH=93 /DNA_ID=CAMNT_0042061105 /DNA_START=100 /DNA_END=381 /DNA_ORIENTATION=-